MRFLLAFIFCFLSVFAIAQAPPMKVGGPQGIDVTRSLNRDWISIPIYVDTPAAPLTGAGWPGAGYLIQASKNYREATVEEWLKWVEGTGGTGGLTQLDSIRWQDEFGTVYFLPQGIDTSQILDYLLYGDTSVWHYTGKKWRRVGGNAEFFFNYLLEGGEITQVSPVSSRQFIIAPAEYYISGLRYKYDTSFRLQAPTKAADSTGRIDLITISSTGPRLIKGQASRTPYKPRVPSDEIELSTIYFRPFDTIPAVIGGSGGSAVTSIYRIPGKDSIFYTVDTLTFKIRDSIGISGADTAAMLDPYKYTAANGLTKDSTVFRLGGSLNQNTNINLNTRRLTFIAGSDTTRMFANGALSIGGAPDSTFRLSVRGDTRMYGGLRFSPPSNPTQIKISAGNTQPTSGGNSTNDFLVAIGSGAASNLASTGGYALVAIGVGAGSSLTTGGGSSVLIGRNAGAGITTGVNNTMFGMNDAGNIPSGTSNSIHIVAGGGYENNFADTALLGLSSKYALIGGGFSSGQFVNDFYLGAGHRIRASSLAHINLFAPSAFGTNLVGSNFGINAGRGTGAGIGGSVIFRTSDTTSSGTTLQTLSERARVTPRGNVLIGTSADSTYRLYVSGGARADSLVVDSIYAKFGRYTTQGGVTYNPIQFRNVGSKTTIDLRPSGGGEWNANWYGAITHNGTETDFLGSNYGSMYIGSADWAGGTRLIVGGSRANPAIDIKNSRNILIGTTADSTFKLDVNGRVRVRDTMTLSTSPVSSDTTANDLLVINSSNGQVRRYTGAWPVPSITALNGLTRSNDTIRLGGTLNQNTIIKGGNTRDFTLDSLGAFRVRVNSPSFISYGSSDVLSICGNDCAFLGKPLGEAVGVYGGRAILQKIAGINRQGVYVSTDSIYLERGDGVSETVSRIASSTTDTSKFKILTINNTTGSLAAYTAAWPNNGISGSATLDFPSTNGSNKSDLTITVNGAADGDVVSLGVPNSVNLNHSCFTAWVSNTNEVTVRFSNYGTGALDPVSATFKVKVFK